MDLDAEFQKAIDTTGAEYADAEKNLRANAGPDLATLASNKLQSGDPIEQLLGHVMNDVAGGSPSFDHNAALEYLSGLADRYATKVVGYPPPIGVAGYLEKNFGDRAAELMALRLAKGTDWPRWQQFAALLYLSRVPPGTHPLATGAVLRYAAEIAGDDDLRQCAIAAIRQIGDPELIAKAQNEKSRHPDWHESLNELIA
jgi:hypothetical protein